MGHVKASKKLQSKFSFLADKAEKPADVDYHSNP